MDFFAEQDLNFEQVKALTAGMYSVAKVDGVHDREMAMIRGFYESCARAGDPRLEDVLRGELDIEQARKLFERPEQAKLFTKTLVLLAFADGSYGKSEDALIRRYAERLGLSGKDVDALVDSTKEHLLSSLAHVQNTDALQAVARRLAIK